MASRSQYLAFILVAGVVTASAQSPTGTLLRHESPTFTLEVPAGFERITANQQPPTLYSFGEPIDGAKPRLNFSLQDMGRPFRPRRLELREFPEEFRKGGNSIEDWQYAGLTLSAIVSKYKFGSMNLISLNIRIPLKDRGLQINVTGALDREQDARRLMDQLLGSLRGDLIDLPVEVQAFAPSAGVRGLFAWTGIAGILGLMLYGTIRFAFWSGDRRLLLGGARSRILVVISLLLVPSALYQLVDINPAMPYWLQASGGTIKLLLAAWALVIYRSLRRGMSKGRTALSETALPSPEPDADARRPSNCAGAPRN